MRIFRLIKAGLAIAAMCSVAVIWVSHVAALAITASTITFPDVTLNGSDQTVVGTTSAWQADATGETGGWNLTVTSTDFEDGSGNVIAVSNFEIQLRDENIVWVSGESVNVPVSTLTSFASLGATAIKVVSAAVGYGDGVYDLTPDFRLTIPAETYAGSYTATVTVTINAGP